jgi:hypothetical protein
LVDKGEIVRVMVMDGQGGGIGATIIKGIREAMGNEVEILALGTNSIATSRMMKAGANRGATGENAICRTSQAADIIMGPLAVLVANSMMGEVTPRMAEAVGSSGASKILIPLIQERVKIVGVTAEPLPHLVNQAIRVMKEMRQDV